MKKLLGSTLALAMIFPYSQANAELLKNFKLSGQLDLQGTSANNVTDFATRANPLTAATNNDRIGDMQTRLLLSADWDLLDDVHSKVTLRKNDRTWGTAAGVATAAGSQSAEFGAGGANVLGNVFVDQAYFKIDKVFGSIDSTFGRQFYGNPGDLVVYFGPSDKAFYGLPSTALDTARFDWSNDSVGVTGIVGKVVGTALGVAGANADLRGVTAMCKGHENVSSSVYLYNLLTHNIGAVGVPPSIAGGAGGKNDNLYVLGVKGKVTAGGAWAKAELDKNFGENRIADTVATLGARNYTGWAFLADVGMKADINGVGSISPWGELGYGTGRSDARSSSNQLFTSIASDYRPGSIYGRFAPSAGFAGLGSGIPALGGASIAPAGLGNRVIWGLGVKGSPASLSKLTAGVSYWDYHTQTAFAPVPERGTRAFGGNKHIGYEVDLDATWQHSDNVTLGAGVGTFQPGGMIKEANQPAAPVGVAPTQQPTNPATLAYMDVRVKF